MEDVGEQVTRIELQGGRGRKEDRGRGGWIAQRKADFDGSDL